MSIERGNLFVLFSRIVLFMLVSCHGTRRISTRRTHNWLICCIPLFQVNQKPRKKLGNGKSRMAFIDVYRKTRNPAAVMLDLRVECTLSRGNFSVGHPFSFFFWCPVLYPVFVSIHPFAPSSLLPSVVFSHLTRTCGVSCSSPTPRRKTLSCSTTSSPGLSFPWPPPS